MSADFPAPPLPAMTTLNSLSVVVLAGVSVPGVLPMASTDAPAGFIVASGVLALLFVAVAELLVSLEVEDLWSDGGEASSLSIAHTSIGVGGSSSRPEKLPS